MPFKYKPGIIYTVLRNEVHLQNIILLQDNYFYKYTENANMF